MTRGRPYSHRPGWGTGFTRDEIERTKARQGLLSMEVELSRACNLRCTYCYAEAGAPGRDELTLDDIIGAVDQGLALGARKIVVLGGGESFCHPRCMDLVRHIHKQGAQIELFTNGTLLTREIACELRDLQVSIVIKMNSRDEAIQDSLAGVPGTFAAIHRGLAHLREAGYPSPDAPLGTQTVVCRQNIAELPEMWVELRQQDIIPYFEAITLQGRARAHPELLVSGEEIQDLFAELARIDRERFGRFWYPHLPVAAFNCDRHEYSCTVTASGDVLPCPGVDIPVGNVRTAPLAKILAESPIIHDLRDIRRRIKGACASCDMAEDCYGCRGMAFQVTGDYLAPDPLCPRAREDHGNE